VAVRGLVSLNPELALALAKARSLKPGSSNRMTAHRASEQRRSEFRFCQPAGDAHGCSPSRRKAVRIKPRTQIRAIRADDEVPLRLTHSTAYV